MRPLLSLFTRFAALFRRTRRDADMSAELQVHVDALAERNVARGMAPDEARYAALREFGGVEQIKERCRDEARFAGLSRATRELRFTLRSLVRDRRFTPAIVATAALCLGATTVIGSALYAVYFAPLPFHDAERIVVTYNRYPGIGIEHGRSSVVNYLERQRVPAFAAVAAIRNDQVIVQGDSERQPMMLVTPSFFRVLGVEPFLGRTFTEEEAVFGHDNVVILGYAYWQQHFGGDPAVIGKTMQIEDGAQTIIGVMPRGFQYLSSPAQLWQPLAFTGAERQLSERQSGSLDVIARLRPGTSVAQAQAQVDALNRAQLKDDPNGARVAVDGFRTAVVPLRDDATASVRPALRLITAGVALLVIIGVVNMANLVLVRFTAKTKELAVRHALGASRSLLAARVISEALAAALGGAVVGIGGAWIVLHLFSATSARPLPLDPHISLRPAMSGAAFGLQPAIVGGVLALALVVGVVIATPAWMAVLRGSWESRLSIESRGGTMSRPMLRLRHGLVICQVALACVLLSLATLLGLSLRNLLTVNPGFQPDHVVTAWVGLPWKYYEHPADRLAFAKRWLAALAATPGVTSVGFGTSLPVVGEFGQLDMRVDGSSANQATDASVHHLATVSGDYFSALGIPLRAGRLIDEADMDAPVCVVDESFATWYWPHGSAIGHHVWLGLREANDWTGRTAHDETPFTIVGVVGTVKQTGLTERDARGMVYYPFSQKYIPFAFAMLVRTSLPDAAIVPSVRTALRRVDSRLPLDDVRTMPARIDDTTALPRAILWLTTAFSAAALVLGSLGVYSVVAYVVAQREREIAIRFALGAQKHQIMVQFLSLGVRLTVLGAGAGVAIAVLVGAAVRHLLFEVSPLNALALGGPLGVLTLAAVVASLLPSRRASAVDPAIALRAE